MAIIQTRDIFKKLNKELDKANASYLDRLEENMAYRAALYLLRGDDYDFISDTIDTKELAFYADQFKRMGGMNIREYAKRCYGGIDPEKVDLKNLKYEYFLFHTMDYLKKPEGFEGYAIDSMKQGLREKLQAQERDDEISCTDYWLSCNPAQQAARNAGDCREADKPVYEYEADDEVWKDYVAGMHFHVNRGAVPLTHERVKRRKETPIDALTLRSKRTVEHVKRGELDAVAAARQKTEKSFTFLRKQDLEAAQAKAQALSRQMNACTGDVADSREWRNLKGAVFKFQTAETPEAAAAASAGVLLAVEKFTKGKKNASQPPEVKACVDLALKSLETTIPDAARNPSVQPLVDRFNEVRRYRLQLGSMVHLEEGKALSAAAGEREILEHERQKLSDYVDNVLNGPEGRIKDYEGAPLMEFLDEAQAREHVALAIALEEAQEGKLNVRSGAWDARLQALKADPVVKKLAEGIARDQDEREFFQQKSYRFGAALQEKYENAKLDEQRQKSSESDEQLKASLEKLRKAREEQARLEKQQQEREAQRDRELQAELDRRTGDLNRKLEEMGSDDYYKFDRYDPVKARDIFAEALAVKEMQGRKEKGEKPTLRDLELRTAELKKDRVVSRMGETLPGDPVFRTYLSECEKRGVLPLPTVTSALEANYKSYSKGKNLSEYYMEQRQASQELSNGVELDPRQVTRLAARLVAIKEQENLSGGRDCPVDEELLEKRTRELEQEPDMLQAGKNLLAQKHRPFLTKLTEAKLDPERFIASTLFSAFQKRHPDKVLQPKAEEPKQPKAEEPKLPKEEEQKLAEGGSLILQ